MPFYWSANSVPELARLPKDRRKSIWKECYGLEQKTWRASLTLMFIYMSLYCGIMLFFDQIQIVISHKFMAAGYWTLLSSMSLLLWPHPSKFTSRL